MDKVLKNSRSAARALCQQLKIKYKQYIWHMILSDINKLQFISSSSLLHARELCLANE